MKVYGVRHFGIENLVPVERGEQQLKVNEVLAKFHAVSLNYRDLMFVKGVYNPKATLPAIQFPDGLGEVVAVGVDVTKTANL